jgi:hypothetical protein
MHFPFFKTVKLSLAAVAGGTRPAHAQLTALLTDLSAILPIVGLALAVSRRKLATCLP